MIVEKAVNMAKMMNVPVLGIVENMSYFHLRRMRQKAFHLWSKSFGGNRRAQCEYSDHRADAAEPRAGRRLRRRHDRDVRRRLAGRAWRARSPRCDPKPDGGPHEVRKILRRRRFSARAEGWFVLLVRHVEGSGTCPFPKGHVEPGETESRDGRARGASRRPGCASRSTGAIARRKPI